MNQKSRSWRSGSALAAGGAFALLLLLTHAAEARRAGPPGAYAPDYVVAERDCGNGSIRGAVRPGRNGWQVRMPRGTWIDCGRSCSDTLRRQTVDVWESNFRDAPGSGRGYLRWDF
jgi:hypothetical protein